MRGCLFACLLRRCCRDAVYIRTHRKYGIASNLKGILLLIYLEAEAQRGRQQETAAVMSMLRPFTWLCLRLIRTNTMHFDVKRIPICLTKLYTHNLIIILSPLFTSLVHIFA